MRLPETCEITSQLQRVSAEVCEATLTSLESGMTEIDIAELLKQAFAKNDITKFWYDVPINVLVGPERFVEGLTTSDYDIKRPQPKSKLAPGLPVFIDLHPMDTATGYWGDYSRTIVFNPRSPRDDEQVEFLRQGQTIQQRGIAQITAATTGAVVLQFYKTAFAELGATLVDVRENAGHSIHAGPKDQASRVWLDAENNTPLGEGLFAVEPGGYKPAANGDTIVARFEDCIYIPPTGSARIL